jgi:hypothetical protein
MGRPLLVVLAILTCISQVLPPPKDGEIRVVYWELRDQTDIFLTIVPQSVQGASAPSALGLSFTCTFPGRTAKVPVTDATVIGVKATAGLMWAPAASLWLDIDGDHVDLASDNRGLISGVGSDYLAGSTTVHVLARIAAAKHVSGNVLGFAFELTGAQRAAISAFVSRLRHSG